MLMRDREILERPKRGDAVGDARGIHCLLDAYTLYLISAPSRIYPLGRVLFADGRQTSNSDLPWEGCTLQEGKSEKNPDICIREYEARSICMFDPPSIPGMTLTVSLTGSAWLAPVPTAMHSTLQRDRIFQYRWEGHQSQNWKCLGLLCDLR